jgi:hypothetical protein
MRNVLVPTLLTAGLLLAGCAPLVTQSPGAGLSPVNAISEGADKHLMLFGYDVVSYFTEGRFSKPEHKALFDASPEKYIPQFGGYCTNGIVYGIPWGGNADTWQMIDGKLYIFGGQGSKDAFLLDVPRNMALANKYWSEEMNGSNAFWQRSKRMVFRVPHYKSGAELAAEVAAKKKG